MKILFIIFLSISWKNLISANEIDQLKTEEDVERFLIKRINKNWEGEVFLEMAKPDTAVYSKNKFYKIDLDANGLTDLVVDGKIFFAIVDRRNKRYTLHPIDRATFFDHKYCLKNIIYQDKIPLLIVKRYPVLFEDIIPKTDTLIFKFGDFIEFNNKEEFLKITEVKFSTSGCFGRCPVFKLAIQENRNATYEAIEYNKKTGVFNAKIDTFSYNRLIQTIRYMKITDLKDNYLVGWTDDQTGVLEIKFNDENKKKIRDYGMVGTFGLANLYKQLFFLRKSQNWKRTP